MREWPARSARALGAWARRPSGRLVLPGLLILVLVAATGTAGAYLVPAASRSAPTGPSVAQQPSTDPVPTTQAPIPPAPPPTLLPTPSGQASPGRPSDV
ncbi:MAG TPA: murein transglycosylase, partial [Micromonosporaceae bacterium]|nr:murein transglycosylase [Micromonosporaceae bacterium]